MSISNLESELYYLITKYLESGPCKNAAEVLRKEIEENQLLTKRLDWLGDQHDTTYDDINQINSHISSDHLIKICQRIGPILDKEIPPSVQGVVSLLGAGRQSLLRNKSVVNNNLCSIKHLSARHNGAPFYPSPQSLSQYPYNIVSSILSREYSGPTSVRLTLPTKSYSHAIMYRRVLGHLSPIYCVTFDRTGRYIFTGADDSLVKIWSAKNGRLLATLRGHMNEISDLAVNYENSLVAAASCDKMIRVWCLKTSAPVAVLMGHNATISSIKFCPLFKDDIRYLVSTANDGCVCFWKYNPKTNEFNPKPIKLTERNKPGNQLICSSFSVGGIFLAVGSSDNYVRVYHVTAPAGPTKILEIEQHSDDVDSLQFSNYSTRFVSGSKDGVAHIWYYERQNWHNLPLRMTERLPGQSRFDNEETTRKLKVSMVAWTSDDVYVITSLSDFTLKVWNSNTGQLVHILYGHEDEVFVIEAHPKDGRIFISGGYDGRIIIWDVISGQAIKKFYNVIDGQGHAAIHDCRFSPDGLMFAATDSLGHLSFYGFGHNDSYQKVPDQIFFHTDYRPLVRDANQYVIDEQTQTAPHLMPPPFLVDIDGNPYPPNLQRLVPGRENCTDQALVPYIAVHNENGVAEVLQPVIQDQPGPSGQYQDNSRRTIDDMIERLAQEQGRNLHHDVMQEHDYVAPFASAHMRSSSNQYDAQQRSPRSGRNIMHRGRQQSTSHHQSNQGVRQSNADWRSHDTSIMKPAWAQKIIVTPLSKFEVEKVKSKADSFASAEEAHFNTERKKRPLVNDASVSLKDAIKQQRFTRRKRRIIQQRHGVDRDDGRIRRVRRPDGRYRNGIIDYENPEDLAALSDDSDSDFVGSGAEEWEDTSSDSSESSESENSDDSEWEMGNDNTYSKKNKKEKVRKSQRSSNESEEIEERSDEEKENEKDDMMKPSTSRGRTQNRETQNGRGSPKKKSENQKIRDRIRKQKLEEKFNAFKELPEEFRPPEWLTEAVPKKFPYFPQIGDEVVYFRQGHQAYIDAVRQKKVYNINQTIKPYRIKKAQCDEVFAKVVEIKYDVKPPRLVILKLMMLNHDDNSPTGEHFTVKYHDMEDVIDFIVLRQIYDIAIEENWQIGDEFRAIIDEKWWFGKIVDRHENDARFPQSQFQCFKVHWASGDHEHMSPWDLVRTDDARPPACRKDSLPITTEERLAFYIPKDDEWPLCGREEECKRIAQGLAKIMEMGPAEPFAFPVDLDQHPIYGITIPYPIDLSTIKARVENQFYRRVDAIKTEISFIEENARLFNEPTSQIVKKAKIVSLLCKTFIDSINCTDPMSIYLDLIEHSQEYLLDTEETEEDDDQDEEDEEKDEKVSKHQLRRNPLRNKRKRSVSSSNDEQRESNRTKKRRKDRVQLTSYSWKKQCRELLNFIFRNEDSSPFRSPVDPIQYPNYNQVIDTPMDLTTVKEQLLAGVYQNPNEFCKDMRLIFQNSKTFNTNKKSRIYAMTVKLQTLFESKMREILSDYRSAVSYEKKIKSNKLVSKKRIPISQFKANNSINENKNKKKQISKKRKQKQSKKSKRKIKIKNEIKNEPSSSASLSYSPTFDNQPSTSGYRIRSRRVLQPSLELQQINNNNTRRNRRTTSQRLKNDKIKNSNNRINNNNSRQNNKVTNGDYSNRRYSTRRRKPRRFYDEDDEEDTFDEDNVINKNDDRKYNSSSKIKMENHMNSETEIDEDEDDDVDEEYEDELYNNRKQSTQNSLVNHMDSETEIEEEDEEEEDDNYSDEDYEEKISELSEESSASFIENHTDSETEIDD